MISKESAERVCPCAAVAAGRVYPLDRVPGARVDDGEWADLVGEVADLLCAFEFPTIEPDTPDWYALSWCLWRYVYGHRARGRHATGPGTGRAGPRGGVGPAAGPGTGGAA